MALPSTVYRATVELSDLDRSRYESLQTTLARHPSETAERLVTRLLAYALFYEPELSFTKGISAGDEPDLWAKGPDGRVTVWLEVGLPEPERLVKASRHAEKAILLACGAGIAAWKAQHLPKLNTVGNLTVTCVDYGFVQQVASRLQRSIDWSLTVTEGTLYLTVNGETLETGLVRLA